MSAPDAARRVAQHRLRHVVAGGDGHRRLLPVAAPGAPALVGAPPPDDAVGRRCLAAVAQREGAGAARAARPDPRRGAGSATVAQLVPYETTDGERDLALALDIPMYGADPGTVHLGTKSGCRELFARVGVPHPLGVERIAGTGDAIAAIAELRARRPRIAQLVVKLNEGVSGARQRDRRPAAACPLPARPTSSCASASGCPRWRSRTRRSPSTVPPAARASSAASSRSASPAPTCAARACS